MATTDRPVAKRGRRNGDQAQSAAATTPQSAAPAAAPVPAPPERDELRDLLDYYGGAGGSYVVRIEREKPLEAKGYLGTVELGWNLHDEVKARWGGGHYYGRICDAGTGKYLQSVPPFTIAGPPRSEGTEIAAPDYVGGVKEWMAEQLAKMERSRSGSELLEKVLLAAVPVLGQAMIAAISRPAPAGGGIDTLALVQLLRDEQDRGREIGEQLAEIAKSAGPGSDLAGVIEKWAPMALGTIGGALQRRGAAPVSIVNPPAVAPVASAVPAAAAAPVVSPVPSPSPSADMARTYPAGYEWLGYMAGSIKDLCDQAAAYEDPAVIARVVHTKAAPLLPAISQVIGNDDFVDQVLGIFPELRAYHGWVRAFLLELRDLVIPPAEEPEATEATAT